MRRQMNFRSVEDLFDSLDAAPTEGRRTANHGKYPQEEGSSVARQHKSKIGAYPDTSQRQAKGGEVSSPINSV